MPDDNGVSKKQDNEDYAVTATTSHGYYCHGKFFAQKEPAAFSSESISGERKRIFQKSLELQGRI